MCPFESWNCPTSEQSPTEWKCVPCHPGARPPGLIVTRTTVAFSLERIAILPIWSPLAPTIGPSKVCTACAGAAGAAGVVTADGAPVRKPSDQIAADAAILAEAPHPYVSRGGVKLAAGLDAFAIEPAGCACLDLGASTGGFSDVLLRRGAAKVYAID